MSHAEASKTLETKRYAKYFISYICVTNLVRNDKNLLSSLGHRRHYRVGNWTKAEQNQGGECDKASLLAAGATHENNIFPTVLKTSLSLDIVDLQHAG